MISNFWKHTRFDEETMKKNVADFDKLLEDLKTSITVANDAVQHHHDTHALPFHEALREAKSYFWIDETMSLLTETDGEEWRFVQRCNSTCFSKGEAVKEEEFLKHWKLAVEASVAAEVNAPKKSVDIIIAPKPPEKPQPRSPG